MTQPPAPTNLTASYSASTPERDVELDAQRLVGHGLRGRRFHRRRQHVDHPDRRHFFEFVELHRHRGSGTGHAQYRVRAVYGLNSSAPTNVATVTTTVLKAPTGLSVTAGTQFSGPQVDRQHDHQLDRVDRTFDRRHELDRHRFGQPRRANLYQFDGHGRRNVLLPHSQLRQRGHAGDLLGISHGFGDRGAAGRADARGSGIFSRCPRCRPRCFGSTIRPVRPPTRSIEAANGGSTWTTLTNDAARPTARLTPTRPSAAARLTSIASKHCTMELPPRR